jgi:hypothetical protein
MRRSIERRPRVAISVRANATVLRPGNIRHNRHNARACRKVGIHLILRQ